MRVYLVQHGEATAKDVNPERPLTDKGRRDVEAVAAFIGPLGLRVSHVLHSGKTRAAQTAEILGTSVTADRGIVYRAGLAPNDPVAPLVEELTSTAEGLMIVGHLPFMGKLASTLLTGSESVDVVVFRQGGVVCLERDDDGTWRVAWIVVPELLDIP